MCFEVWGLTICSLCVLRFEVRRYVHWVFWGLRSDDVFTVCFEVWCLTMFCCVFWGLRSDDVLTVFWGFRSDDVFTVWFEVLGLTMFSSCVLRFEVWRCFHCVFWSFRSDDVFTVCYLGLRSDLVFTVCFEVYSGGRLRTKLYDKRWFQFSPCELSFHM